jgi:hypothetical protein
MPDIYVRITAEEFDLFEHWATDEKSWPIAYKDGIKLVVRRGHEAIAALASAPVDGSGEDGVEDEPVLHFCTCKQIDRSYDSRQPIVWNGVQHRYDGRPCHVIAPPRRGGCGHHDDHYPSCPVARGGRCLRPQVGRGRPL